MSARRDARTLALQTLFEIDFTSHDADEIIGRHLEETHLPSDAERFLRTLVNGVLAHQSEIDDLIHIYAPEWPVRQMAVVDRNILRIAIFEIAIHAKTPPKVAIDEAVELAKTFASDSAPRFINGVLGTLVASRPRLADTADQAGSDSPA